MRWGPNWEDDLAGAPQHAPRDPSLEKMEQRVAMEYEQAFMFYLRRICEHCLNPSCVALPLHPEFRTLPMVWYVPPLSPVVNGLEGARFPVSRCWPGGRPGDMGGDRTG